MFAFQCCEWMRRAVKKLCHSDLKGPDGGWGEEKIDKYWHTLDGVGSTSVTCELFLMCRQTDTTSDRCARIICLMHTVKRARWMYSSHTDAHLGTDTRARTSVWVNSFSTFIGN